MSFSLDHCHPKPACPGMRAFSGVIASAKQSPTQPIRLVSLKTVKGQTRTADFNLSNWQRMSARLPLALGIL